MGPLRRAIGWLALLGVLLPGLARADRSERFRYRHEDVWRAAVRLVRVDYGFPIREKDREGGYVVFDYVDGRRKVPGAVEVVELRRDGQRVVLVRITIEAMPGYVERMMMDRLRRKLRDELGPEPRPRRRPPAEDEAPAEGGAEE